MVVIMLRRDPKFETDLARGFKPVDVTEGDFTWRVAHRVGLGWEFTLMTSEGVPTDQSFIEPVIPVAWPEDGKMRLIHRRQRLVRYVSHDQNRESVTVNDLGPASGEPAVTIPCDEQVDMAQAWELLDFAARKRTELAQREALVKPARDRAMLLSVEAHVEEAKLRERGVSSFGPDIKLQRESA